MGTDGALPVVEVVKQKLHGGSGRWLTYHLGDDEHGSWLFHPERTTYVGASADGERATCFAGQPEAPGKAVLLLVPRDAWWLAMWRSTPQRAISVDLCRPTVRGAADGRPQWRYDDLELDLWAGPAPPARDWPVRSRNGRTVAFDDEDELADAVAAGAIDAASLAAVRAAADDVADRILDAVAPFTDAAWDRLAAAAALDLPGLEPPDITTAS